MATLTISFRQLTNLGYKVLAKDSITGAKMSKTWIRKHYGNNADEVNDEMYYIKKHNKYGIVWVVKHNGYWNISTSKTHGINGEAVTTPSYDINVYLG